MVDAFVQDRRDIVGVDQGPRVDQLGKGPADVEAVCLRVGEGGEQGAVCR